MRLCKALHKRKNYMFAGSEAGAERAAIIYSLVGSCKLNDIDPFAYALSKTRPVPCCRVPREGLDIQPDDLLFACQIWFLQSSLS